MDVQFDIGSVVATVIAKASDRLFEAGKKVQGNLSNQFKLRLNLTFETYLLTAGRRLSRMKTLVFRDEPRHLYDFYVPLDLKRRGRLLRNPKLADVASVSHHILITGSGGCGKSTFMRHLFLDALRASNRIPVFFELRKVNETQQPLLKAIVSELQLHELELDEDYILEAIKSGLFVFLLDGFDEVTEERISQLRNEIHLLSTRFDENIFVVSSRPDQDFLSWERFTELHAAPLSLEKACTLIERLGYDPDISTPFVAELRNRVFSRHKSLLSNRLLLTIMLLTYDDRAAIPDQMHTFYSQAFEALFSRHDATKGGFRRRLKSRLSIDQCRRFLEALGILTYLDRAFEFRSEALAKYLDDANQICGFEYDRDKLIHDLLKALCLLVQDGLTYSFAHRSFQEYFAAAFICRSDPDVRVQLVQRVAARLESDSTIPLLFEMDPVLVEATLVLPFLRSLNDESNGLGLGRTAALDRLEFFAEAVRVNRGAISLRPRTNSSEGNLRMDMLDFIAQKYKVLVLTERTGAATTIRKVYGVGSTGEIPIRAMEGRIELINAVVRETGITKELLHNLEELRNGIVARHAERETSMRHMLLASGSGSSNKRRAIRRA